MSGPRAWISGHGRRDLYQQPAVDTDVDRAVGRLLHGADLPTSIEQQSLLVNHVIAFDDQPIKMRCV